MQYTQPDVYEFISKQTNDPIVERKTCSVSGKKFPIYQTDLDFYSKISPIFAGEKFQIPTPTLCPEERERRRLCFRNERKLYRRTCDASQKNIISIYSPDKPYIVYDQHIRRGDSWDPMEYGRPFDFTTTFTEQFGDLMIQVPRLSLVGVNNENSEYTCWSANNKNCYMTFMTSGSEDSLYGTFIQQSKHCIDCYKAVSSEHCYACSYIDSCNNLFYSSECTNCSYSYYIDFCYGCSYCYACHNLKNKQYCIFNKQYTKEEYFQKISSLTIEDIKLFKKSLDQESTLIRCEECYGAHITDSKRNLFCQNGFNGEDCKYVLNYGDVTDAYDCSAFGYACALNIENVAGEYHYHTGFNFSCMDAIQYCWYCMDCYRISHCFGCIGLRDKQYCVFNKQYTKKEYEILVADIIRHMLASQEWGQFFHPQLSPFGYNETVAQEYYPQPDKTNIEVFGYTRSAYQKPSPTASKIFSPEDLPSISEVSDDICSYAIACEQTQQPFRIVKQELDFYRKHSLPLPRLHPDKRHEQRMRNNEVFYL